MYHWLGHLDTAIDHTLFRGFLFDPDLEIFVFDLRQKRRLKTCVRSIRPGQRVDPQIEQLGWVGYGVDPFDFGRIIGGMVEKPLIVVRRRRVDRRLRFPRLVIWYRTFPVPLWLMVPEMITYLRRGPKIAREESGSTAHSRGSACWITIAWRG